MTFKQIIKNALVFSGRVDLVDAFETENEQDDETREAVETLLFCVNAVEDELARNYIPLKASQSVSSTDGKISYSGLSKHAIKILSVKKDGKNVAFKQSSSGFETEAGTVTVEYNYAPARKEITGESEFSDYDAGQCLVAAGAASEYCLIRGDATGAQIWEKKYRSEIESAVKRRPVAGMLPPRRWV